MPPLTAVHADIALRGAVAGLLLFHVIQLALPGPRLAVRVALGGFALSVLAYLFCQHAEVLLALPRPLAYALLVFCVSGAGLSWVAARALFDDHFRWSWPVLALLGALLALGLAANVPYFPDGVGPFKSFDEGSTVAWFGQLHALSLIGFSGAAVWEVTRGWRADLVEARRVARRWVALAIGLYAALALVVELALRGRPVGLLLPALHVLGIGFITLALAVLIARSSLAEVLGIREGAPRRGIPLPPMAPPTAAPGGVQSTRNTTPTATVPELADARAPAPDRFGRWQARLDQAMATERAYRREGLTLADLADTLGMPEAALRELINQRLGFRNFNDFLHHHRLGEAAQRLANEELPILSIALECGYGSIGPFNRAFKLRFDATPTEFRAGARRSATGTG